jgi:hypothetical protein
MNNWSRTCKPSEQSVRDRSAIAESAPSGTGRSCDLAHERPFATRKKGRNFAFAYCKDAQEQTFEPRHLR